MPPAPTIFVSIASYNDPQLPRTLLDCIAMAERPDSLRFGICWQFDTKVPVNVEFFRRDRRFRWIVVPIEQSQGGTWARSQSGALWDGEDYALQIDSHMKFEASWDTRLIEMLEGMPSDKPLLSVNTPLFWYDAAGKVHRRHDMGVPTSRVVSWHESAGWSPWVSYGPPNVNVPARQRFITGNFAFTHGRWCEEVPQDPDHYYWGEELNLTIRSYSWGYDLFLPTEILVWHLDHRSGPPRRHWENGDEVVAAKNAVAFERLRKLLYSDEQEDLGRYGLGPHRSRHDYEIYAGFDFAGKRAHPDVYTGRCPDPVTISCAADWQACLTFEEARSRFEGLQ